MDVTVPKAGGYGRAGALDDARGGGNLDLLRGPHRGNLRSVNDDDAAVDRGAPRIDVNRGAA